MKQNRNQSRNGEKNGVKEPLKQAQASWPDKPKGPRPASYAPKMEKVELPTDFMERDIRKLMNGSFDREEYLINNAVFVKTEVPLYRGGTDLFLAVEFYGAVEGHELVLSGVMPGSFIFWKTLLKPVLECDTNNKRLRDVLAAIHKYLWKHMGQPISVPVVETPKPDIPRIPRVVVEPDPTDLKIIWEGKNGIVANGGMRFRVTEATSRNGYDIPAVYGKSVV